jgi:hypothetical protein
MTYHISGVGYHCAIEQRHYDSVIAATSLFGLKYTIKSLPEIMNIHQLCNRARPGYSL